MSKSKEEQHKLVTFCIKEGAECRKKMKKREKKYVDVMFGSVRASMHKKMLLR